MVDIVMHREDVDSLKEKVIMQDGSEIELTLAIISRQKAANPVMQSICTCKSHMIIVAGSGVKVLKSFLHKSKKCWLFIESFSSRIL
jgi:hypothetical protein